MYNNSFKYYSEIDRMNCEALGIYDVIKQMIENKKLYYHNDIFNRQFGFVLTKIHRKDDVGLNYTETITLNEIPIRQIMLESKNEHKYSFKERLRILFKGK